MTKGFDETKDVLIGMRERFVQQGKEKITLECRKYDTYAPKVQVGRWFEKDGRWVPAKLGRLTREELNALDEMIGEIKKVMDDAE